MSFYTASAAITPNDSATLATVPTGVYVGGAGDVKVLLIKDTANTIFKAVPVGTILPIRPKQVFATNTSATNLLALY